MWIVGPTVGRKMMTGDDETRVGKLYEVISSISTKIQKTKLRL